MQSSTDHGTAAAILVAKISKQARGEAGAHAEVHSHFADIVSAGTTGKHGEGIAHAEVNNGTMSARKCPQRW